MRGESTGTVEINIQFDSKFESRDEIGRIGEGNDKPILRVGNIFDSRSAHTYSSRNFDK